MFHFPIDIDAAVEVDCPIRKDLALLAAGLDTRFLRAGTTLARAIEMIDRMIAGLDSIAGALDADVAGAAVADLLAMAGRLTALPAVQADRAQRMETVAHIAKMLRDNVMELHQSLRILNIYGMNIKIAASGEPQFVAFVDGIADRLGTGEALLAGFMTRIKDLTAGVAGVQQSGRLLVTECSRVIPAAPRKLIADAEALETHLAATAKLARKVAEIARSVQGKVAVVLGALQVGDSTRQRLEHAASTLQLLQASAVDGAVDPGVAAHVERLVAAQLDAIMQDFSREAGALVRSMAELGHDSAQLADLIAEQADGNDRAFLNELDQGISNVERLTVQLRAAEARSGDMAAMIVDTVTDLSTRLDGVKRVAIDVQDISTNTRLLCRRHGTAGKAVAVIAREVDAHALTLTAVTADVARATDRLRDIDPRMRQIAPNGAERDMGETLAEALLVIRRACDRTEEVTAQGADDARQLVTLIFETSDDLRRELAVTEILASAMATLSTRNPTVAPTAVAEQTLRDLLQAIGNLYTMAPEREVHARFLLPGMDAIPAAAPVAEDDDDGLF